MEISHVLLRCCLQVNSIIVCANERIPQRARESAFLGSVHFAHCQKLLTGRGFLSGTVLQAKIQNTEQEKTEIE